MQKKTVAMRDRYNQDECKARKSPKNRKQEDERRVKDAKEQFIRTWPLYDS